MLRGFGTGDSMVALRSASTFGGTVAGRKAQCWIERPLHDGPLPLVVNNWPALDDPVPPFEVHDRRSQSCH